MELIIPGLPDEIGRECLIRVPYSGFHLIMGVSKRWRQEVESEEFHRERNNRGFTRPIFALTQSDPIVPVTPGNKFPTSPAYRLKLYDSVSGDWAKLPPIPGYPNGLPLFCQCAGVGRKLVVIGGWNLTTWDVSNSVYVFDFVSGAWRKGKSMPGASRSFFACASDNDRTVYVAGGHDEEKNALRSALAYDVTKDEWASLPDMSNQRDESKGLFHAGKFHVIGGYPTDMQGRFARSAEAFDVAGWRWDPVDEGALDADECPRTCVFDFEGNLLRCRSAHLARKEGDAWRPIAELPVDVRVGPYVVTCRRKMLVIGSGVHGGPHSCYELNLEDDDQQHLSMEEEKEEEEDKKENKKQRWRKVETAEEFTGHVQAGCSLII